MATHSRRNVKLYAIIKQINNYIIIKINNHIKLLHIFLNICILNIFVLYTKILYNDVYVSFSYRCRTRTNYEQEENNIFATTSRTKDAQEGETSTSSRFPEAWARKNRSTTKSKCVSM